MRDKLQRTISDLLARELVLYEKLKRLVDEEIDVIESDDMDRLLRILEDKQSIISEQEMLMDGWHEVSHELGVSQGREEPVFWKALSDLLDGDGYRELKEKVRNLQGVVETTLRSEELAQRNMGEKVSDLRKRMSKVADGKRAVRGYMGSI